MIQQIIQDIVASLTIEDSSPAVAPTYLHGWRGQLNIRLDEITNEVVWLLPVYSNTKIVGANIEDTYSLVVGFFGKSELDWFAEQHLPVIDRQRRQCAKFIYKIQQSELLKQALDFIITDEYNAFDVGLSGVTLQCKITPLIGPPAC